MFRQICSFVVMTALLLAFSANAEEPKGVKGQLPAAASDAKLPVTNADVEAKLGDFCNELFFNERFTTQMKPIVDALEFMADTNMTLEAVSEREAAMAKQWKEQAGPIFFERLAGAGFTQIDMLNFLAKMHRENDAQQIKLAHRIRYVAGADSRKFTDVKFIRLALSYIHGRLIEEMWGKQSALLVRANDSATPSAVPPITIKYTRTGGHAPGNYSITILGGNAAIVTPGRPPVTSNVPAAPDEVEHFCALFRLGNFFTVPATRPPTSPTIIDRPEEILTLTVGPISHSANCTDTQNPYLRNLIELFREIIRKQEIILDVKAAATARAKPSSLIDGFQGWQMPLRAQCDQVTKVLEELLECLSVNNVVGYAPSEYSDAISPLASPRAVEILVAKLKAQDRSFPYVVEALGRTGDPRAIPPLLNLLEIGNHDPLIICALARLGCRAVLEEALTRRSTGKGGLEVLSHIGRDDPRLVALVENDAYGWFTDRHSRAEAVHALARMGRLPTPTKAGLFAHVFAGLVILAGSVFLIAPRAAARLLGNTHCGWLAAIGIGGVVAGVSVMFMLHFTFFF